MEYRTWQRSYLRFARATWPKAHQRIRSPLERLRRFIRTYVSLEGAAVVGLYLTLWFWIGLVLDYGVFRLFHFDWVQETAWGFRCGVLVVLLSGLLAAAALTVLTRLFREFRDAALALVLERRYPQILGDRLITAVELADPRKAAEIGYSPAMVQETIHEAAQRVDQLQIKEVFDWERLVRRGVLIGILLMGGYFAAVGIFCTANAHSRERLHGGRLHSVSRCRRDLVRARHSFRNVIGRGRRTWNISMPPPTANIALAEAIAARPSASAP